MAASVLVADLENMGYVRNPYDKSIMRLPSSTSSKINDGTVLIAVDDILEGGPTARHRKKLTASIADGNVA
eukprot:306578-Karenia_brevis.AAC.1